MGGSGGAACGPSRCRFVDEWVGDYRVFWDTRLDSLADHLKGANPR
jgi:hypothetical protein